jgi:biopolymer transport protein ExbB
MSRIAILTQHWTLRSMNLGHWAVLGIGLFLIPWALVVHAEPSTAEGPPATSTISTEVVDPPGHTSDDAGDSLGFPFEVADLPGLAGRLGDEVIHWYRVTPPGDRVSWGGLAVCCLLGCSILLERLLRLRERTIIPADFTAKFLDRLHGGKLDAGRALDYCEENPSPAARVALAAVRRWGRPAADLERAVALAHRVESDRLRRNVGTFRRLAVLAPLIGFLGTLLAAGRILAAIPPGVPLQEGLDLGFHWGPELASALGPLTAGVVIATLAVVAYDGLQARIERLAGSLDRLGAETIDAIAMAVPIASASLSVPTSRAGDLDAEPRGPSYRMHAPSETAPAGVFGLVRPPHASGNLNLKSSDQRTQRFPRTRTEGESSAQL